MNKYIFDGGSHDKPNLAKGAIYKVQEQDKHSLIELDIQKIQDKLGVDELEAIDTARVVVNSIFRLARG